MAVPILLIALFQAYWIRQSHKEETRLLRKEGSMIFRDVFFEAFMGFKPEGNFPPPPRHYKGGKRDHHDVPHDSLHGCADSLHDHHEDSLHHHDHHGWADEEPYMLTRMQPDSLNLLFQQRLKENDLDVGSNIIVVHDHDTTPAPDGMFRTIFMPWQHEKEEMICAEVSGYGGLVFRRILPHIGVSVVLVSIVLAALLFFYRNLKTSERSALRQRQFVSNVTHELKTPVSTVKVALEALKNFHAIDDAEKTREYLDISTRELDRLNQMTDRILQMNLLESGEMKLQPESCNLQEIAQSATEALRIQAEQKNGFIHLEAAGSSFTVTGDKVHLLNIFYNLIDNAIKYSPSKPEITVSLRQEGSKLIAEVKDLGVGIAKEEQSKIFGKFYRVQKGDRHDVKGYGLGLSYVQEMMKLHGGSVSVKSAPGKGSIFTLQFPNTKPA